MFGGGVLQTLEPRLFYNYIPAKSQNDLPNFDSSESSFGYGQLFRENLYYGNDRINTANSLSAAVQSRILDGATGKSVSAPSIGQKFYFKDDAVMLDGSVGKNRATVPTGWHLPPAASAAASSSTAASTTTKTTNAPRTTPSVQATVPHRAKC